MTIELRRTQLKWLNLSKPQSLYSKNVYYIMSGAQNTNVKEDVNED